MSRFIHYSYKNGSKRRDLIPSSIQFNEIKLKDDLRCTRGKKKLKPLAFKSNYKLKPKFRT